METLLAVGQLLNVHALAVDPVIAQSSQGLVTTLRNFIGPLMLLSAGIAALYFLFNRAVSQFLVFLVIFVGVAAIFYSPQFVSNLGTRLGQNNSNW